MPNNKDDFNERRRKRIRAKKREELKESIAEELDDSERAGMEKRLAQHRDQALETVHRERILPPPSVFDTPERISLPPSANLQSFSWRVRWGIRLARWSLWWEKKIRKFLSSDS